MWFYASILGGWTPAMAQCFILDLVVVSRRTQAMVVSGSGEGHSRDQSVYLLLLLEYSCPIRASVRGH